jgi:hypothetical protein
MLDGTEDRKMSDNERAIAAFAGQFVPPLKYCKTERINNIRFPDAWQVSYWDNSRAIGITAVAYEGQIHAFIEAAGTSDIAQEAGRVMAAALGLLGDIATGKA